MVNTMSNSLCLKYCMCALTAAWFVVIEGCSNAPPASVTAFAAAQPAATAPSPTSPEKKDYVASGPIIVENQVEVAAQRGGVVDKIFADTGALVKKGALLGQLDDRQLTAERDAAAAKLRGIQADVKNWEAQNNIDRVDLQRAEKMMSYDLITREELDHARYKVTESQYQTEARREDEKNAEANLRSLNLELEKTRITAPFSGMVARRYVNSGQTVAAGDRLFWVTELSPLLVKFILPERFSGHVKKGDAVSLAVAESSTIFGAHIASISPVVDPASDSIEVVAKVDGASSRLRPGMTAQIHLPNQQ
jgi:membrane fusion protein (multidrug efflux system)